jgi:hypothetical protein
MTARSQFDRLVFYEVGQTGMRRHVIRSKLAR